MSHVTLASSSVPNRPGQPIRRGPRGQRGRHRSPPPPTYLGAPAGCRPLWGWLSRIAAAPPSPGHPCVLGRRTHHRSPPDWRVSTEAPQGGHLPHSPPRSPPPPPHCHDGRGSAARGRVGATRGLRRGPTPRAASWGCWRVPPTQGQPRVHTARAYSRRLRSTLQRSQQLELNSHSVASTATCCTTIPQGL